MKKLGICSSHISEFHSKVIKNLNYETLSLYNEGKKAYDDVILINPRRIIYKFIRNLKTPELYFDNINISDLTTLIVRGTKSYENSISIMVHSLKLCECDIIDPIERFTGAPSSKLLTTLERHEERVGTDSFLAFDLENSINLIHSLFAKQNITLLTKPIDGKKGKDVIILNDVNSAIEHVHEFFKKNDYNDVPLFLQQFMDFQEEYRVILIDGECLGVVRKCPKKGSIVTNAEQGGTFIEVEAPDIVDFTIQHVSKEGILGVDVARDSQGQLHIIEANRSPLWGTFEQATGINVAKEIICHAAKRIYRET